MADLFVLYESSSGYALLKTKPLDGLGMSQAELAGAVGEVRRAARGGSGAHALVCVRV